jgi:hypothetical protein
MSRVLAVVSILGALVCLTACERVLSGRERSAVLEYSEAATDNLLAGWTAGDYAAFSRDFDADLQEEIPVTDFAALKEELDGKLGDYLSRTVEKVTRADEFCVVTYRARFEREDPVVVTVAFHAAKPPRIAFLSFDSKKASWSAFQ